MIEKYTFPAISLYFSGVCNLHCTYCFQPKIGDNMKIVNDRIINWILSGDLEKDLKENFNINAITDLSLWGGEPTINLPYLILKLEDIYKLLPNLKSFSFSSNLSTEKLARNIVDFARKLDELNKKFNKKVKLDIQISVDGPDEISVAQRIGLQENAIRNNTTLVLQELDSLSSIVSYHFKSTFSQKAIEKFSEKDNLISYFKYFDDLYSLWISKNFKKFPKGDVISFAMPGNYTAEDGKNLKKLTEHLLDSSFRKNPIWNNPNILSFSTILNARITKWILSLKEYRRNPYKESSLKASIGCSGGKSCIGLSYDGKIHLCQSSFFFDDEVNKLIQNKQVQVKEDPGFDFSNFSKNCKELLTSDYKNPATSYRNLLLYNSTVTSPEMSAQAAEAIITELALCNQISPCFLEEPYKTLAASFYTFGNNVCISNNAWSTGSLWIPEESLFKLYFNGAFEALLKCYRDNKGGRNYDNEL